MSVRARGPDSPVDRRSHRIAPSVRYVSLGAILLPSLAFAESSTSLTGIPLEYLFGAIATLLGLIYSDLKREIRSLHSHAKTRSGHIRHVESAVRKICSHLNIDYRDRETDYE